MADNFMGPQQPLSDDDYKQLGELQAKRDPRASEILKTLNPQEMEQFLQTIGGPIKGQMPFPPGPAGMLGELPNALNKTKAAVSTGGSLLSKGIKMLPGIPSWIKILDKLSGLGDSAEQAVMGKPASDVSTVTPPMSEEAYQAAAGHPRLGEPGAARLRQPPTKPSIGGVDSAGLKDQPNVSTTRTAADVHEQVTGSSRIGYEDSRSTPLEYGPASDPEVASVQAKIKSQLKKPRTK